MPAAEHGAQEASQLTEQPSIKTDSKGLKTRPLACVFGQLE